MSNVEQQIEDDDNCVTMLDVLQKESQLEEDANAVLGASDDKNCTFNKGYIRQALYACKTCCSSGTRAAVCLACSFHCHEGHDLVELYTKRHFRCDCGNEKFGEKNCTLDPLKTKALNDENSYNQNFDGVYCTCARPYPDPENDDNDEMLQCVICEDWYHSKHLGFTGTKPEGNAFDEVVCSTCMRKNDFLWRYAPELSATSDKAKDKNNESLDKIEVEGEPEGCVMPTEMPQQTEGACYWIEGWRSALCTCDNCKKMYEEKKTSFLLDPLDSVQAYEEQGKNISHETQYEKGMKALNSLGHVEKMTAIEEYNEMKENLIQYLRKFAETKKVVREEDIKEFFDGMGSRKRPKTSVQTFCR